MKGKFLSIALILLAAIFIGNQVISAVYSPITTETAAYHTVSDGVKASATIFRSETLVYYDGEGVMHFLTEDGKRISKNGIIANVYGTQSASITVSQIESVKAKIEDIEEILSYNDFEAANLTVINSKIDDAIADLLFASSAGEFLNVNANSDELLSLINRRQAAMGDSVDFTNILEGLKSELSELNKNLPKVKTTITAEKSGYFVSKTDGYEQVYTADNLSEITPEFLDSAERENHPDSVIGKIVSDYEWYIAATVSITQSKNYKEGDLLKLKTNLKSAPELNVKVAKINTSQSGSDAVIVFSCDEMNSELSSARNLSVEIINAEYSGLKVSKKALRVVDSVRGVYLLVGMQAKFVPIEIVYTAEDYIICKEDVDSSLELYDCVIVKGRNLYDGKIIT